MAKREMVAHEQHVCAEDHDEQDSAGEAKGL
jgi:hypothetical protein